MDSRTPGKMIWRKKCGQQFQVQLEEDGHGSIRQNWMEKSGLWCVLHWEWQHIKTS